MSCFPRGLDWGILWPKSIADLFSNFEEYELIIKVNLNTLYLLHPTKTATNYHSRIFHTILKILVASCHHYRNLCDTNFDPQDLH